MSSTNAGDRYPRPRVAMIVAATSRPCQACGCHRLLDDVQRRMEAAGLELAELDDPGAEV